MVRVTDVGEFVTAFPTEVSVTPAGAVVGGQAMGLPVGGYVA